MNNHSTKNYDATTTMAYFQNSPGSELRDAAASKLEDEMRVKTFAFILATWFHGHLNVRLANLTLMNDHLLFQHNGNLP